MTTVITPEVSAKNKYWVERHRYYELKHFSLQYPLWKKSLAALDGLSKRPVNLGGYSRTNMHGDPTCSCAEAREWFVTRIEMIERVAGTTSPAVYSYILKAVTEGVSYEHLRTKMNIPCCRDTYYGLYRRYFWLLDRERQ